MIALKQFSIISSTIPSNLLKQVKKMKSLLTILLLLASVGCHKEKAIQQSTTSTCDTLNITYANTIKPILRSNCYECHSTANTIGNPSIDFENFTTLKTYLNLHFQQDTSYGSLFYNNLKQSIGAKAMPPYGKLGNCELRSIQIWIAAGAPNN